MKAVLIGILTFIFGVIISFLSTGLTGSGGNAEHIGVAIMIAILYLSAVVTSCTFLIIKTWDRNKNL